VSLVIRRTIHPRALRLVLLHEIYRGPERRQRKRILIGHPVRVRAGLFASKAMLLELSPSGARIEMGHLPKVGRTLHLILGRELTKARPLKLRARVVRCIRPAGADGRHQGEIGVSLLDAKARAQDIQPILERFALGPAAWLARRSPPSSSRSAGRIPTAVAPPLASRISDRSGHESVALGMDEILRREEESAIDAVASCVPAAATPQAPAPECESAPAHESSGLEPVDLDAPTDRRDEMRVAYEQRIVALDEEAARVLVGRDLSQGGMRIAPTSTVALGHVFRLALHNGTDREPVIVIAEATRDDGEDGIVLTFRSLDPVQRERLDKIIDQSGAIHVGSELDGDSDLVEGEVLFVGEVLDTTGPLGSVDGHSTSSDLESLLDAGESVEDAR
jgi:hypothetical protein